MISSFAFLFERIEAKGHNLNILLVEPDYYSTYPPLGLLKLSRYHKNRGDKTILVRHSAFFVEEPDFVYITSLFTWGIDRVKECAAFYRDIFPDAEIFVGGIAASLLPDQLNDVYVVPGTSEILDDLLPDYSLIPEWTKSLVFASRGCINRCPFCAVPQLEPIYIARKSISDLISQDFDDIILWDNNFLASPHVEDILNELIASGKLIDFNQGLDCKLISHDIARELKQLKVELIRIAFDSRAREKHVRAAIENLVAARFRAKTILVYILYNFRDSPEEFLERMNVVLSLGASVYPMRYQPLDALKKNDFVETNWTRETLDLVPKARRVIGFGGAFPPYAALVKKFSLARTLKEALELREKREVSA